MQSEDPLKLFHPLIQQWFTETKGIPTDVQCQTWPLIADNNHLLISAPTGSGKTLSAFLWSINQLITGNLQRGVTRILYISPLKALNNDIRENLLEPLQELKEYFEKNNEPFPDIQVQTRSGDTPSNERTRMLRNPPEIFITTPESLNIMLTSKNSRSIFTGLQSVIVDEIHAIVGSKRGAYLITAIERLTLLAGEFQRIALSATISPMEKIAAFIGGYKYNPELTGSGGPKRDVVTIKSDDSKTYDVTVLFPENAKDTMVDGSWWPAIIDTCKNEIHKNKSTLLFANSRKLTEKVTRFINEHETDELAYSHHGSLSKEIRLAVEKRLKKGQLKAIVATSSLELGIDIGDLDSVILIQTPFSISSAIQRIGRSGHGVGEKSRGIILPTHGRDFINGAVAAKSVMEQDIEEIHPTDCPLDILAQIIISMTLTETWDIDSLHSFLQTSYPYRNLTRKQFDLVIQMLAGRYADTRIRELKPKITIDKIDNTITARKGTQYLLYFSGGTIPDRGYFDLRVSGTKAKIGELDEEFVWERNIGETFSLGNQTWRIQDITHNDVLVTQTERSPGIIPFWKAEVQNRDFHFSERIGNFLKEINSIENRDELKTLLTESYFMDTIAAEELIGFINLQKEVTGTDLPHRHHCVIEHYTDPTGRGNSKQVVIHNLWGGKINRPLALAFSALWEEQYGYRLEIFVGDDALLLILPHDFKGQDIFKLINPDSIESYIRKNLETTGFFGARFRENAGRSLMLPKAGFKQRYPLWLNRLRAKKLMESIIDFPDFPILLETWRTCMQDHFDIENLKKVLFEIQDGDTVISETTTKSASPFASGLIYRQIEKYMYDDDTPASGKKSGLTEDLLNEVAFNSHLRPEIPVDLIKDLDKRLKRTAEGYAPDSDAELLDWIKERILIPGNEWNDLMEAVNRDHGETSFVQSIAAKVALITPPDAEIESMFALENLQLMENLFDSTIENLNIKVLSNFNISEKEFQGNIEISKSLEIELESNSAISQWFSYYGPVTRKFYTDVFGINNVKFDNILKELIEKHQIILDSISDSDETLEFCHIENLEILLRMLRKYNAPQFQALPADYLQLFLADHHGLTNRNNDLENLQSSLEKLFGYPLPTAQWEESIFPARITPYYTAWLDSLMQNSELIWFGCGNKKSAFSFYSDMDLFKESNEINNNDLEMAAALFPYKKGKYGFFDITKQSGLPSGKVSDQLWEMAWKGIISNDSFSVLRNGIITKFKPSENSSSPKGRRSDYNRWLSTRPMAGNWYILDYGIEPEDAIENHESIKDRVRLLFKRYGILFREILANELKSFRWSSIFKTLRIMELSGEVMTGHFFIGIPGLQFISNEAFLKLKQGLPMDAVYWINAIDPASLCGIRIEELKGKLPSRLPSNSIVFHGTKTILISKRNGESIEIFTEPEDPHFTRYLSMFREIINRDFNPVHTILIEEINGEAAADCVYTEVFKSAGFRKSYKGLELLKKF